MRSNITINGKVYDAVSGLPVAAPEPVAHPTPAHHAAVATHAAAPATAHTPHHVAATSKSVHRATQRSQTLRRQTLKKPAVQHIDSLRRAPKTGHVAKSPLISKFAPHPQPLPQKPAAPAHETVTVHHATSHPAAHHTAHRPAATPALSSRELKQKLIAERLASVDTSQHARTHKPARRSLFARTPRVSTVIAASLAVVVLGGYLTYINMPSLSMRVAAASSGVNGEFPEYRPDGYHFNGPIVYTPGEITLSFASNTNQSAYTITQKSSSWDSQAVLDNYVTLKSTSYDTYSQQGLTIYTYGNNAAWVNGGTFYTIEGNAPLSNSQILRIASSM